MIPTTAIMLEIANLHDAFMNSNLMRTLMEREESVMAPQDYLVGKRGRLERACAAYLYILIEAWRAKSNASVREYMETKVSLDNLKKTLREAEKSGLTKRLREPRHYMCYRDKRQYWDDGRYKHLGNLTFMRKLNDEFGGIFLSIMRPWPE